MQLRTSNTRTFLQLEKVIAKLVYELICGNSSGDEVEGRRTSRGIAQHIIAVINVELALVFLLVKEEKTLLWNSSC